MSKHALITGASGFVGGWMAEFLVRSGYRVSALVRNPSAAKHLHKLDVELIRGDLSDVDTLITSVKQVSSVFHVAGLVRSLHTRELYEVNETGARNVLNAAVARQSPPSVVLVSSLAAAGPSKNHTWKTEGDPTTPVSNYGKSKLSGERVARAFADRLHISVVRPPIVFGGRDTAFAEMIRPIVQLRLHPYPGTLPFRRYSIVHVQDLCRALWLIAERGEPLATSESEASRGKGVYFVADPHRFGYIELGQMIARSAGIKFLLSTPMTDPLCWIGGIVNELLGQWKGKCQLVNFDKVRECTAGSWTCSPEKILRQLAWSPQKTAAERMQETVDWYFSEGWFKPPAGYRSIHAFPTASPQLRSTRHAS